MSPDQLILYGLRLFTLAGKLLRDGRNEATPEEMAAAKARMDQAEADLEAAIKRAEGGA